MARLVENGCIVLASLPSTITINQTTAHPRSAIGFEEEGGGIKGGGL